MFDQKLEEDNTMQGDLDFRNRIISDYMGKLVHIVVDRPIGYRHGDIIYPINYGYIPGLIAGDGEEQDAYILGIDEPITEFEGRVIAAIRRKNDCEDKLVVAPMGKVYHQAQIAEAVHFQEQYFISTIDSLLRKSCGVIPFRWCGSEKAYLILLQTNHCWSFPKGHMEAGETEEQTALRELFEETGLRAKLIPAQRAVSEYDLPPFARKQVVFFLGEIEGNVIPQETEVLAHKWVKACELKDYLHPDTYTACAELLR
jgi:8-oxo-dGTP pyrophosphatase MutT (NUDIX family)